MMWFLRCLTQKTTSVPKTTMLGVATMLGVVTGAMSAQAQTYGGIIVTPGVQLPKINGLDPAVADLKATLTTMTGASFTTQATQAASAIRLALTGAPGANPDAARELAGKGLSAFLIEADARALTITANDTQGLSNGIAWYLESLGVRWLLPGAGWTDIPRRSDITLATRKLVVPAFKVRSYAGTGGYFSWKWGRTFAGSAHNEGASQNWERRLRYGGDYRLGKAVGEGFIADKTITPILAQHPDYLAKVKGQYSPLTITGHDGQPTLNIIAKLNAGNPAVVSLFCDWVIRNFREARKGPDTSRHEVASVEPADGYDFGDNVADLPGDGSPSDQSFFIANQCAREIRQVDRNASVILLAYSTHSPPPSFPLESNVIVQVTPYGFQDRPPEQFIADWAKRARRLALYDYWSIPDWTHDEPTFDWGGLARRIRYWRANRIEGINAETTYSAGAMGLGHYLAAHLMWDPDLDEKALIDDWFARAFGPAKAPVRRMMTRWMNGFVLASLEIGQSFRDLDEARRLAAGNEIFAARIDDFVRYVQYLRLRLEYETEPDAAAKSAKSGAMAEYLIEINDTMMVHSTRIIDLMARTQPVVHQAFGPRNPGGETPGWARVHPLTHRDVAALLDAGLRDYPPSAVGARNFSGGLVPVTTGAPKRAATWEPVVGTTGNLNLEVVVPAGETGMPLRVSQKVGLDIALLDAGGAVKATSDVAADAAAGGALRQVTLSAPPGRYTLRLRPEGNRRTGYFQFQTRSDAQTVLQVFLSPKQWPSPKLYFYVPRDTRRFAMHFPYGDYNNVFKFEIADAAGAQIVPRYEDGRRTLVIDVPAGQDGTVWSMLRAVSPDEPMRMIGVPQAFALSPDSLRTPSDALARR